MWCRWSVFFPAEMFLFLSTVLLKHSKKKNPFSPYLCSEYTSTSHIWIPEYVCLLHVWQNFIAKCYALQTEKAQASSVFHPCVDDVSCASSKDGLCVLYRVKQFEEFCKKCLLLQEMYTVLLVWCKVLQLVCGVAKIAYNFKDSNHKTVSASPLWISYVLATKFTPEETREAYF